MSPAPPPPLKAGTEKRQAKRVKLVCPMAYQTFQEGKSPGPFVPTTTVDISTKGALIRTTQPLEFGGTLRLQIQVPGSKAMLLAQGRVVRVEEEEPARKYLAGLCFEKLESPEPAEFLGRLETLDFRTLLESLLAVKGSDLHLTTGQSPIARVQGRLQPLKWPSFQQGDIRALLYSIMAQNQITAFEEQRELDFAYSLSMEQRFRFNLHWQRGQVEATIRVIPAQVMNWQSLGVPPAVIDWTRKASGLILIVGPTGAGKTSTLNALVDHINHERDAIILCLERPIEYLHHNIKSVIKQREVGSDTLSYAEAVKRALRQDPDVITVGEVEDSETAQVVLNAAETGNLVLASFHATNTTQAIDRFLGFFSPQQRDQAASQLASCLLGVLTQYLLRREEGGLVLATEVFVATEATRNMIRTNSLSQVFSAIQTGGTYQMHTLEHAIKQLLTQRVISSQSADSMLALATRQG